MNWYVKEEQFSFIICHYWYISSSVAAKLFVLTPFSWRRSNRRMQSGNVVPALAQYQTITPSNLKIEY